MYLLQTNKALKAFIAPLFFFYNPMKMRMTFSMDISFICKKNLVSLQTSYYMKTLNRQEGICMCMYIYRIE